MANVKIFKVLDICCPCRGKVWITANNSDDLQDDVEGNGFVAEILSIDHVNGQTKYELYFDDAVLADPAKGLPCGAFNYCCLGCDYDAAKALVDGIDVVVPQGINITVEGSVPGVDIPDGGTLNFEGAGATTVTQSGNTVTISSPPVVVPPETVFAANAGPGISITSGGVNGHSPTIALAPVNSVDICTLVTFTGV